MTVGGVNFNTTASAGSTSASTVTGLLTALEVAGGPPTGVTIAANNAGDGLVITDTDGDDLRYKIDLSGVGGGGGATLNGTSLSAGFNTPLTHTGSLDFTNAVSTKAITLSFVGDVSGGAITLGEQLSVASINLSTVEGAQRAIGITDAAIDTINNARASLGAIQNRLESTISNLTNISENISAARSRVADADFAAETASLTRNQILQQASISILSQANALPQQVLALLQ